MDAHEERLLARRARAGDRHARDVLIRAGLPWASLHARRLGFSGTDLEDAVQDGCEGLIAAVDRFDPDRGVRLVTFAWPWIEGAIRRGRARTAEFGTAQPACEDGGVEPPQDLVLQWRFGFADGRPHTRREVARHLGLSVAQVRRQEARALSHLRTRLAKVSQRAPEGADPP